MTTIVDVTRDVKSIKQSLIEIVSDPNLMPHMVCIISFNQPTIEIQQQGEQLPKTYIELEKLVIEGRTTTHPPITTFKDFRKYGAIANIVHDDRKLLRATLLFHELVICNWLSVKSS